MCPFCASIVVSVAIGNPSYGVAPHLLAAVRRENARLEAER